MSDEDAHAKALAEALSRGALIQQARRRLRFEKRLWCSFHGQGLVGAIVEFQDDRCLYLPGGVDQHIQRDIASAHGAARSDSEHEAVTASDYGSTFYRASKRFWQTKAEQLEAAGSYVYRPWATVLGPFLLDQEFGRQEEGPAVCGKCHRGYRVTITTRRDVFIKVRTEPDCCDRQHSGMPSALGAKAAPAGVWKPRETSLERVLSSWLLPRQQIVRSSPRSPPLSGGGERPTAPPRPPRLVLGCARSSHAKPTRTGCWRPPSSKPGSTALCGRTCSACSGQGRRRWRWTRATQPPRASRPGAVVVKLRGACWINARD